MSLTVACEGQDASGKATQSKILAERLGGSVVSFPAYDTPVGHAILGNLKSEWRIAPLVGDLPEDPAIKYDQLNALVLQCLMTINRLEVMPTIDWDRPVVFDRYYASALVYGTLDGLDPAWIKSIQAPLPDPDVWVLIDMPPEESVRRRPERRDRYEKQAGFMEKVRAGYLDLFATRRAENWHIVDGMGTVEEVAARVWTAVHS